MLTIVNLTPIFCMLIVRIKMERAMSSFLLYIIVSVYCYNVCHSELLLQDVNWTKTYNEEIGARENSFGTCRLVEYPCVTNNEPLQQGVCVPWEICSERGGYSRGYCDNNVCCSFQISCSENLTDVSVTELVTRLNVKYDSRRTPRCTYKISKQPQICQVRLDFFSYEMTSANPDGICESERLQISNSVTVAKDFTLCGNLTGQHMYLAFGGEDSIDFSQFLSQDTEKEMLVTMIPCGSKSRVPDHCLQHFTNSSGQVESFDFGGQQQSNQRYTVCVKPFEGSEYVEWKACSNVEGKNFDIASNSHMEPLLCTSNWVQVKGQNYVCEQFLSIRSKWKPYELLVNFDNSEHSISPPIFIIPTDPSNCEPLCVSQPGAYTCSCIDNPDPINQICRCTLEKQAILQSTNFNNTGFCLEYTQK